MCSQMSLSARMYEMYLMTVLGLLDLANAYCEPILKKMCEQIIKKGMTTDNVAMLYAAAIKFEAKVTVIPFLSIVTYHRCNLLFS